MSIFQKDIASMENALENGNFKLYLQPKHHSETGKVVGAESLSRLILDDGTFVMPLEYIEEFEENGFVKEVDFYMLEQVCKFLSDWREKFGDGIEPFPISINFSKVHFEDMSFINRFKKTIAKYDIPLKLIEIEITENHVFHNWEPVKKIIDELRKMDVTVAIDDYGNNSSAFSIIRRIDIDTLKIDRAIILESESCEKVTEILNAVVGLTKKLDIYTVAEGVETERQLEIARKAGCNAIQGWYFSKALPMNEFEEYVLSKAV